MYHLHPLFANVPSPERDAFIQTMELRSYGRNEPVLAAGDWTDRVYCVADGLLHVVAHGGSPAGAVVTDFVQQDEFFLGPSLKEDAYRADQTLVAALPSSLHLVPLAALRSLCATYPDVAMGLLGHAMKRIAGIRSDLRRISA